MLQKCRYCQWIGLSFFFEEDHIIPSSRKGSDQPYNRQWICSGCNRQKSDKTPNEYILWRVLNPSLANRGPFFKY